MAGAGFAIVERRPDHRGGRARPTPTGSGASTTCSGSTVAPAPPERLRADRRAGDARWPPTPTAIPTTTSRPAGTSGPTAMLGRGRVPVGGDLQLGPTRARVPAQRPLLGPGRLPGHRLGRPLPPGRAPVVERPDPRPLRGARRAGRAGHGRRGGAHRRAAAVRGAWPSGCARRPACPRRRCPTTPSSPAWSTGVDGRAVLTVRGRLLANAVTARLVRRGRSDHGSQPVPIPPYA